MCAGRTTPARGPLGRARADEEGLRANDLVTTANTGAPLSGRGGAAPSPGVRTG
jgi:hypothetical protein